MSVRRPYRLVVVAVAVVLLGACGGGGGGGGKAYQEPKGPARETIKIEAGNFYFKPDTITTTPGIVNLELEDAGGLHTLVFDGAEAGFQLEVGGATKTDTKKIQLSPGKYTFFCDIPGHRAAGMHGTITVK